jgi:hypothetical protein
MQIGDKLGNLHEGFNGAAIWTVVALATSGLLVSFVLKYLDNFAEMFRQRLEHGGGWGRTRVDIRRVCNFLGNRNRSHEHSYRRI